jgi:hypothetical protein
VSLQKQIPQLSSPLGTKNPDGTISISTAWYQFLMSQYLLTIGSGLGTSEADLLASSDIEMLNSLGAHGYTGTATATFTSTNKPGSNAGVVGWIPINMDGVIRYLAVWG